MGSKQNAKKGIIQSHCFLPHEKLRFEISAPQFEHLTLAFTTCSFRGFPR